MKKIKYIAFLLSICVVCSVEAKDLGVVGTVYQIKEQNILEFIKTKLLQMQASGEIDKKNKELITKVKQKVDRPAPVQGITRATETKVWDFDPTYTATKDIFTPYGVVVKKGDKVNPLDSMPFTKVLIFYDGTDADQVIWVKNKCAKLKSREKLILVNGAISDQSKIFNKPIYFDQAGRLTTKFNIKHVPAMVKQNNKLAKRVLEVSEIKIGGNK